MNKYFLFLLIILYSCGTKTIKDKAIVLKGPIVLKYQLSKNDSVISIGSEIKMTFAFPDSIKTLDGIVIQDIEKCNFAHSPIAEEIDSLTDNAYLNASYNFKIGSTDKSRGAMYFYGGKYCEDTYVCKDTGVFWFSFMNGPSVCRIWTKDGKEYIIGIVVDFDIPNRHTDILFRLAPSVRPMVENELSIGLGHYCFKVVP